MEEPSLIDSIRPISRKEYDRMVELGFFADDEHVELLDGVMVRMSPRGGHHDRVVAWLNKRLARALDEELIVRPQCGFAASDWSEPEPDIAIVREDPTLRDHPSDALLLIEVADSSLRRDRKDKHSIYARAGVPEYWIVNIKEMSVEVYTQPTSAGFASKQTLRDGDVLRPMLLPGIEIAVTDLPR